MNLDLDALTAAAEEQLTLFSRPTGYINLHDYDLIIINSSAGKDSLATIIEVRRMAIEQNYPLDRIVVQYNELGDRVTWPGTADMGVNAAPLLAAFGDQPGTHQLAVDQCQHFGLELAVTSNPKPGDLLDHIAEHGKFPDALARFCTSAEKRQPGKAFITARYSALDTGGRPPRLLYVFGFRAAESSGRAKRAKKFTDPDLPLIVDAHSNTMRYVDEWYPIFHWPDERVWAEIRAADAPYHWAYRAGMNRLSCSFCVLAGGEDLALAAALRPAEALAYAGVEASTIARGLREGDMRGRYFQERRAKNGTVTFRRTMTDIIRAGRAHPIIPQLGLDTELLDAYLELAA